MEFSSDANMQRLGGLAREFFEGVLFDEEPLFVSDEATIFSVSLSSGEELMKRCSQFYKTSISEDDLKLPLWKLIRELNKRRRQELRPRGFDCP
jgi:hypothetical protein